MHYINKVIILDIILINVKSILKEFIKIKIMIILINICGFFSNFFKVLNWELINNNNSIIVPYFIIRSIKFMGKII